MNLTQQCPHCLQWWWDSHVCPNLPAGDKKWQNPYFPPTTSPVFPMPEIKPEQIRREWTEEEIRAMIREEVRKIVGKVY